METRIIAVANHKGGVGKTTTVATLGGIFAKANARVLMVDLDSQCNLTDSFVIKEKGKTIFEMFIDRCGGEPTEVAENLYLIPGDIDMATLDVKISNEMERERILDDILQDIKVRENFDIVLLDCPPSLSFVIVNAFAASDDIYVPITPEYYPTIGLMKLESICKMVSQRVNPKIGIRGIIINKTNKTKNLHAELIEQLQERYGDCVFETVIRENVKLAEAPLNKMNIVDYAPSSNGATDYLNLAKEILAKISIIDKPE